MSMASDQTVYATKEHIETLGRQIDEGFKSFKIYVDERFNKTDSRFVEIESKINDISHRLNKLESTTDSKLNSMDLKIGNMNLKLKILSPKIMGIYALLIAILGKLFWVYIQTFLP